jgi:hypothetical protein
MLGQPALTVYLTNNGVHIIVDFTLGVVSEMGGNNEVTDSIPGQIGRLVGSVLGDEGHGP